MKKWIAALVLTHLFYCLAAQNEWQIKGMVRSETGAPLPGASVLLNDTMGTVTNAQGFYTLSVARKPRFLTARNVGFFAQRQMLDTVRWDGRQLTLDFYLTPSEVQLPEVSITSQKMTAILEEDNRTYLYDYGFAGEYLLLLERVGKVHFLRLITESGRLLSEIQLPEEATTLHKSCVGDYHAVAPQHTWEVTLSGKALDTFPRYATERFRRLLAPCVQAADGYFYFARQGDMKKSIRYYYIDPDHKKHSLLFIRDEKGHDDAQTALRDFLSGKPFMVNSPVQNAMPLPTDASIGLDNETDQPPITVNDLARYANSNGQIAQLGALKRMEKDSVYAPLLKIKDKMLLFDHVNNELYRFDAALTDTKITPIYYHQDPDWRKELLVDEQDNHKIYARFSDKGVVVLKTIDLNTDRPIKTYALPEVPFLVHNMRVRNGLLYCIGQPSATDANRKLYKIRIF